MNVATLAANAAARPSSSASSSASPLAGGANMGKDAFLQLLVAQLSHQDPLNPQQGHEFAAQLAQFSSVEQLGNISSAMTQQAAGLNSLLAFLEANAADGSAATADLAWGVGLQAASGLVGKTVEVAGSTAAWDGSTPVVLGADVAAGTADVTVVVRDAAGKAVRTLPLTAQDGAARTATWDGRGEDGAALPAGAYTFEVRQGDAALNAARFTRGAVGRVTVEAGGARLWVGAAAYGLADLRAVVAR